MRLGDRPGNAGERFAAIASAGALLAPSAPPTSVAFSNVMESTQPAATGAVGGSTNPTNNPLEPSALTQLLAPATPGGARAPTLATTSASALAAPPPAAAALTPSAPAPVNASATTNVVPSASVPAAPVAVAPGATLAGTAPQTVPGEAPPFARIRFATGDPVLPPVNFSTQALSAAGLIPVRSGGFVPTVQTKDGTPGDASAAAAAGAVLPAVPNQPVTAAQTLTGPAAPPPAAQVADAVISHASVLQRNGGVEFQMRLDPPDLGRIQVQLVSRGDEVHGQVLVASEAVRQVMESQLPELRQRLEAAGVNVQQFSVATDSGGGSRNPYRNAPAPEFAPSVSSVTAAGERPRARIGPSTGTLDVTV
jgi:hypothetical protein